MYLGPSGCPDAMVRAACSESRERGSEPHSGIQVSKKPCSLVKIKLCDREVASSASDRQGSIFESCVWRAVSSHHPQEVLLAQFSLYVHKVGLKSYLFYFNLGPCHT